MTAPVLVVVEQRDGRPTPGTAEVLTLARAVGGTAGVPVHAVWLGGASTGGASTGGASIGDASPDGAPSTEAIAELGRYGVAVVHSVGLAGLDARLSAVAAEAVAAVAAAVEPAAILLVSTFGTKEVAGRLAYALGSGAVVDATDVRLDDDGRLRVTKTVLAGSWRSVACVRRGVPIVTVKPASVRAAPVTSPASPEVVTHEATYSRAARAVQVVRRRELPREGVPLAEAEVVVAGGRGLAGDFSGVRELAEALDAAVGATRDVVEDGVIGHAAQIGQTGTMIAPRLYIGAGISGAVHHTAGMRAAETIVVVNTDRDAPIAALADLTVVGDAERVIPQAAAEIRRRLDQRPARSPA